MDREIRDIRAWMYSELTHYPDRYQVQIRKGEIDYDLDKLADAVGRSSFAPTLSQKTLRRLAEEVAADAWEAGGLP